MPNRAHHTGRAGTGIVKTRVEKIGYIFSDMPQESDYGIDAEIEITHETSGAATGRLLKAQIRSGASYIKKETDEIFTYRSRNLRHLEYWRKHALPVLIIWVDIDAEIAYWAVVDATARAKGKSWTIDIPKAQRIDAPSKAPLRKLANDLADEVAARVRRDCEGIRDVWAEGKRREAFGDLQALAMQPSWRFADRRTSAEAYRSLALWSYLLDRVSTVTDEYLLMAKESDPASDESVVRATMAMLTAGQDAALRHLEMPATTGAANLRAALLFHAENVEAAARTLDAWPAEASRNAETARIEARIALAQGDMARARERIASARTAKERWVGIRESSAIIDYFAALPASEWSTSTNAFPIPIPMPVVRQDDDSLKRLRAAAGAFHDLAAEAEEAEDRNRLRTWHLAALANDPEAQGEARKVTDEWLQEPELFPPMLAWAIERRLAADNMALVQRVLHDLTSNQKVDSEWGLDLVRTAILLMLHEDRIVEARELLGRFEQLLAVRDKDVPVYWHARILIEEVNLDGAAAAILSIEKASLRAEAEMILRNALAARRKDWRAIADERHRLFLEDGEVFALADAARLHAQHGEPDFVLQVADDLFAGIPNLSILEMICEAAWRIGRYSECLSWIDKWRSISSMNTEGLQQTRVACLLQVDPFQSIRAADDLVRLYPSATNVMRALTALLRVGDLKSLSITARRLLAAEDADSATLLSAAQMTIVNDADLSRELWRAAMASNIDDDHVGIALSLAHEVGEDHRTGPLIARMQQLASEGRGGVRVMSFSELLEFGAERQQELAEVFIQYYSAEVPVHGVAQRLGWTLAEIFHVWPAENRAEDAVARHRPLLVRFGGRPSEIAGFDGRKLLMDITGLLLAAELDLLDVIERTYAPIRVSRFLAAAIVEQQRRLGQGQPSRVATYERIAMLADSGKIRPLVAALPAREPAATGDTELDLFLASTVADEGVFVHQLPITDSDMQPLVLDDGVATRVRDLPYILAAANREAVIDAAAYETAVVGLRDPRDEAAEKFPATIVLSSLAASVFASGDGLAQLAASADVRVPQRTIDEARASIKWARGRRQVLAWIDRLREHLHRGFERGTYVTVEETNVRVEDARYIEFEALRDLIEGAGDGDLLWIEDRACSRMGLVIVGISEILADLAGRGAINNTQHSALLHKLRAADARYLPLAREDLVSQLNAARARETPDTKELQQISRLYAAYALDGNRSNGLERTPPEITVFLDASRATMSVLPEIWKLHHGDHARAMKHAWWFMTYVYVGQLAVRSCTQRDADAETARNDLAFDLAHMYLGSLIIATGESPENWEESTTSAYIEWITKAFVYRQFFTDPQLVALTGKHLAGIAATYTRVGTRPQEQIAVIDALVSTIILLLPNELQREWLAADPLFGERHGIRLTDRMSLEGVNIPARSFWAAVERSVAGKPEPRRAKVRARFAKDAKSIKTEYEDAKFTISDPLFVRFAMGDPEQCAEWADAHPTFIDMPRGKRRGEARRIGALKAARDRVIAADALRDDSGQTFYARLREQLDGGKSLPERAFHLSAAALADHMRWRGDAPTRAMDLLEDVGPEEALTRLMTLPVQLPAAFVEALAADADALTIVKRVASAAVSPFSLMQCGALMLRLAAKHPELGDAGAQLVRKALEPGFASGMFETFERAHMVVHGWLSFDSTAVDLSPHDRLVLSLSHAGRLLDVIGIGRVEKASEFFNRIMSVPNDSLGRDPEYLDDVLHPTNLSYEYNIVFGVCSLLDGIPHDVLEAANIGVTVQQALKRLADGMEVSGFFVDRSRLRGRAGTIYERETPEVVLQIVGSSPIHLLTSIELRAATAALLEQACRDVADPAWLRVAPIIRHHAVDEELRPRIHAIVRLLAEQTSRTRLNDRDVVLALSTLAGQAAALQDASLRDDFRRVALDVAEEFGVGRRDAAGLKEFGPAFFEIALGLSALHGDSSASARELTNFVDALVRVWPSLAYSLATRLADYVWTAPPDQALSLWRMLLRARENSFRPTNTSS
jgi:hypothetical protein